MTEEIIADSGSEDEFQTGLLNGGALDSDDDSDGNDSSSEEEDDDEVDEFPEVGSDEEEIDSDEIPSSDEEADEKDEEDEDEDEVDGEVDENGRKTVLDSAGNLRYIYPEVDTGYASDDSDREELNTIGNIDLALYEEYPHVGYDINGKKIMRPAKGKALDALLDTIDVPKGWTGMLDKNTGGDLNLTREELEILRKIQMDEVPVDGYNPYEVGFFRADARVLGGLLTATTAYYRVVHLKDGGDAFERRARTEAPVRPFEARGKADNEDCARHPRGPHSPQQAEG